MTFALDRDLIVLEPNLFRDIAHIGQQRVRGTGGIQGSLLTLADQSLAAAKIDAGHIALVAGVPVEIVARLSDKKASVSRLRASPGDPVIAPEPRNNASIVVYTFAPQLQRTHDALMTHLRITPESDFSTEMITNARDLARVEAIGTLADILNSAGAMTGEPFPTERAAHLQQQFLTERARLIVHLDTDNDGIADTVISASTRRMTRG